MDVSGQQRLSEAVPENVVVFDRRAKEYERWFSENAHAYASELEVIRPFVPEDGTGVEIGVGAGRFAVPLGVRVGVEMAVPDPVWEGYGEGAFVTVSALKTRKQVSR